jgi:hypothetical protein
MVIGLMSYFPKLTTQSGTSYMQHRIFSKSRITKIFKDTYDV